MRVMLLAAGKSTRLGLLGQVVPKPLVPVCGHAPLLYGLAACRAAGLVDVVINVHHHGDQIRAALGDGRAWGVRIVYSDEPEILGTGGGLVAARRWWGDEPVLVMNGKVIADIDLAALLAAHRTRAPGVVATMVVRADARPERFAPVEVDDAGRVVALRGEGIAGRGPTHARMFTGIHVIEPALIDRLPPTGFSDVIGDAYIPALRAGAGVAAFSLAGYFEEHSTPASYLAGNLALLNNPSLLRHPPGALTGVDPQATVEPGARVIDPVRIAAGARIEAGATVGPAVVVGARARVRSGAHVQNTVLWDDADVSGTLDGCVVAQPGVDVLYTKGGD